MKKFFIKYCILLVFIAPSLAIGRPNFILIGPPGSGKGTFSSIAKEAGYHHISHGDILRTKIKENTDLGLAIKTSLEGGNFINDSVAFEVIEKEVLACLERNQPFIIDGFPRNENRFRLLVELLTTKNLTQNTEWIHFETTDQECLERIEGRFVCSKCFKIFNVKAKQPVLDMVCDDCKEPLGKRVGETIENTKKRLASYRAITEPVIDLAKKQGFVIHEINTTYSLEECLTKYRMLLEKSN